MSLIPIKRALVVSFEGVGGALLTSTICDTLKLSFPQAEVDFLVEKSSSQLFLHHPSVDNIIEIDRSVRNQFFTYVSLLNTLKNRKYDVVIDTSSTFKSQFISLFCNQASYRIGKLKSRGGFFFSHKVLDDAETKTKIDQRMNFFKPLVNAGYKLLFQGDIKIMVSEQEKLLMRDTMIGHGIDFNRPRFVFNVSARDANNKWNSGALVSTIEHCKNAFNAQIILFSEQPYATEDVEYVYKQVSSANDVFIRLPTPKNRDLVALFSLCDAFIGNDGEPRQIAYATGIPTATVFSPQISRSEWVYDEQGCHKGIEWRDVSKLPLENIRFEVGDNLYIKLFNSIRAADFIPIVDDLVTNHVLTK